ncbi:MAG: hypothetical protein Q8K58_14475 [Acidimicrobiales bacterium]|nr:hypothetical protein [Acidimicrobiales bacterium]
MPEELDIDALLASLPSNVASSFTTWGAATVPVTAAEIGQIGTDLCYRQYDGSVVIDWVDRRGLRRSMLLMSPADRLLSYTSSPAVCNRPPTESESDAYRSTVFAAVSSNLTVLGERAPTSAERNACRFLDSEVGGFAVEKFLDVAIDVAARRQVETGQVLSALVEVAGSTCAEWLPVARDALAEYLP